ncbi:hydantoinase B/oxoprolinase family protein (plasmid) [Haloferax mediterranei ATCC 33500]|uniref:Hydantoinase B/oxoprolinase family protein n=1 Tax=Haloferax mediterranei (strain ATCC 33500 / DSM 1411 / JCM 8866 / NBRC 14739 / NCIMB 2177 / R-4) TaxID=523841 RepID=I3R9W5_HALMT|nr:hydantoinase B/oxoprolinase family protein [Haloferax mediterranei]AFK21025.1 N-methylhydantoinase B (ATP-hydrolyzing) [Haloferax mediterranei ATCC 33500]AHZ24114.1 N-methylhydantoinase [Haloferax mediterranei ATCC 33500]EMA05189.1 N-methylhydantoinase B (ATP-hydrolyzing) [Haloferax mediterranei ATCC 33500]MDX5990003.1 hydantoinase B/oxoprolinase family protein [Haloferax mediterranei ATCC 33500]QCQ77186.1 hydantoinase B/oxoprolinase family protein [Haloferax mediterranei ATCC 33500]
MSAQHDIDAATVEVIRNYLTSAATEMQRTLIRTAYNTIIYEILDFGISVFDKDLNLIADSPGLALFLGANDYGIEKAVEHVGEENMNPGDVLIMNYPYWSGTHTLDVLLFAPVFHDDELIGYTTCRAHWLDLGAKDSGYVLDSTDVHQEGVLFPGTKVYKEGEPDPEIMDIIRFNSRMPEKVMGDLNAQIAAVRTGEERLRELYEKYGGETVEAAIDKVLEHGENTARTAVEDLPDGTWSATGYADGVNREAGDLIKLRAEVTIDGDEFSVNFEGSSDQVDEPLNIPPGMSETICKLCFKTVTTPEEDSNGGQYEPLSIEIPENNIFNASYPAPTFTVWTGILGIDVVYKALAKAVPDRVPASTGGDLADIMLYGQNPETGRPFVEANNEGVGWGAGAAHDGANALMHISETMVRNIPVEVFENKAPIRFDQLSLREDSGGPGKHRGGLGIRRDFRILEPVGALSIIQKTRTDNWGMDGGDSGAKNVVVLDSDEDDFDDRVQVLVDNDDLHDGDGKHVGMFRGEFVPGEVISNRTAGGGGFGDPFERDPEAVRQDVIDGYVSREAAEEQYGVVVTEDDEIDFEATEARRSSGD